MCEASTVQTSKEKACMLLLLSAISYNYRSLVLSSRLYLSNNIVGLRAQHAIIRDENVPNKALNNVDVALKLNADDASKNDDIDKVRGIFPANHGILKDAGTVTRRRTYKEVLNSFE